MSKLALFFWLWQNKVPNKIINGLCPECVFVSSPCAITSNRSSRPSAYKVYLGLHKERASEPSVQKRDVEKLFKEPHRADIALLKLSRYIFTWSVLRSDKTSLVRLYFKIIVVAGVAEMCFSIHTLFNQRFKTLSFFPFCRRSGGNQGDSAAGLEKGKGLPW